VDYSIPKAYKSSPGMELSIGDELHSYNNGNYSKGIQKTLESVLGGTLKMVPFKS
jgi:hypothetical protein